MVRAVFPSCCLTWGQAMVEVMKIRRLPSRGPMLAPQPSVPPTLQHATVAPRLHWRLLDTHRYSYIGIYICVLEKEMATHSSILAWGISGTEEPHGLSSMRLHRVGHDWSDLAAAAVAYIYVCVNTYVCIHICASIFFRFFSLISSVQSLSRVRLFVMPWTVSCQASLSITNSQSLLKLMSIQLVMLSNHLILCHPLLLPPSIFPSIRVFSNKSVLHIRWPKYCSFSFNISPSNEY